MGKNSVLIIGRFQPIHLGHLSLIKRYYQSGFNIKIGIGSSKKSYQEHNPLTLHERKALIKVALKEYKIRSYKIFSIPDISEDKNYVRHVLRRVGKFRSLVTGNPSVLKLFKEYKTKHPWNLESFEEKNRPGGNVTSGIIRNLWKKKKSRKGLPLSVYKLLEKINFSDRMKEVTTHH